MSSAFSIALSSLQAQSEAINTTGNNLANMNTTGFKGSSADFEDLMSQAMGVAAGTQVGMGVSAVINNQIFTQGSLASSTSPLASAIQGNGFFVVQNANSQQLYTRDGDFTISRSGVLETQTGETVQGWVATPNGINTSGAPTDIVLPTGSVLPPIATQNVSLDANLDSDGTAGATSGQFSTPVQVVDSLGSEHTLTFTFTKSGAAANTWSYDVTIDDGDLAGGTAGTQHSLLAAPGTATFNSDGSLAAATASPVAIGIAGLADGAANMNVNWALFDSTGAGTLTQYAQTSSLASSKQDGAQAAQLTQVGIQNGGQIIATFSNGQQKTEGQLALAAIQNPDSLQNVGNNAFSATAATAAPAIGVPQTGGRGQIIGGSLEGSNVDMATQFTNLIVYQSAYQASSRVITTADNMTQDLMNLIH